MTTATTAAARQRPATRTELDLEARLAARDADMTVRLQATGIGFDVNTAHILAGPTDLAEIVHLPVETSAPLDNEPDYGTPLAAVLQRAHRRLLRDGLHRGDLRAEHGPARCLVGHIRAESRGDRYAEIDAVSLLLDAIRRHFPNAESVPSWSDRQRDARWPARVLGEAAEGAAARGL